MKADPSYVTLRPAEPGDLARVFEYNCSPAVRALSGNPAPVSLEDHERWYARRIADRTSPMWIIEENGAPVGVVRIDVREQARISIALAPAAQGRAIGRRAITLACTAWYAPVTAEIHESNAASRACFMASGFRRVGKRDAFDLYLWSP
jgi:RimJ/RimL family protein N-acetyltransferase